MRAAAAATGAWKHELPPLRPQPDDSIAPAQIQNVVPLCGRKKFSYHFSNRSDIFSLIRWKLFLDGGMSEMMPHDETISDLLYGGLTCS
jgi:hypothetical protein